LLSRSSTCSQRTAARSTRKPSCAALA
jgi:hypothetical protein